jgi:hypothetical protein
MQFLFYDYPQDDFGSFMWVTVRIRAKIGNSGYCHGHKAFIERIFHISHRFQKFFKRFKQKSW